MKQSTNAELRKFKEILLTFFGKNQGRLPVRKKCNAFEPWVYILQQKFIISTVHDIHSPKIFVQDIFSLKIFVRKLWTPYPYLSEYTHPCWCMY